MGMEKNYTSRIKICGLYRDEDIDYVNEAKPDFAGFIIHFPKSHRNLEIEEVERLAERLDKGIVSVGVFVDEEADMVIDLLRRGVVRMAQLHGNESADYIRRVQDAAGKPVVKAFAVRSAEDVREAERSPADYILLDYGKGEGKSFDWRLLDGVERPYFLAGGVTAGNLPTILSEIRPWAVDISSGVETGKVKDREKIARVVELVRGFG